MSTALVEIRGAKSQAKVSMRTDVAAAEFSGPAEALARLRDVEADLRAVGRITGDVSWVAGDGPVAVRVTLAEETRPAAPRSAE